MSGLDMVKMKEFVDSKDEEGLIELLIEVDCWPFKVPNSTHVAQHFKAGDFIADIESGDGYVREHVTRFLKKCAQARPDQAGGWA